MVTRWCILWVVVGAIYCEEVYVEVSVVVPGDFNVSDLYDNLYHPNTSNISISSNSTGNVLNVTNIESNYTIILLKNSVYRVLSVSPILCVIGFDYNCFNDTNVTRLPESPPTGSELPMGYILGVCSAVFVVVVLGIIFTRGFKKPIPEKRLVIPVVIDWPPRNKKPNFGNGMHLCIPSPHFNA